MRAVCQVLADHLTMNGARPLCAAQPACRLFDEWRGGVCSFFNGCPVFHGSALVLLIVLLRPLMRAHALTRRAWA